MSKSLAAICRLVFGCLVMGSIHADDFPPVHNTETSDVKPMLPDEAAATLKLPNGFKANVFAAEPDVQNPIAMAWDDRGRMWIAENYTYADRTQRFDLSLRDRVLIFEDRDGDGKADSRKVFTDTVQMLTSVEVGRGGVWLMCPPQLLFIPDANGDDQADGPAKVVLDGFNVAKDNYHNFANGLRWGPDGWLYGRCGHSCPGKIGRPGTIDQQRIPLDGGMWRYHPDRQVAEVLCHGTTNPWGHDWDENGELFFINTVIGHLWHCLPGSHFKESFGESQNPLVYERMDMIADHYHYDVGGGWMASRDGVANELGGGHAHIGMLIYHGDRWPKGYRGKLMTVNMHGMRVNVERLDRTETGYVGKHEPDFMISSDPFFRGIDLSVGPDGDVYLIDWSDTGECHEHTGVHRESGRIYRISYGNKVKSSFTKPLCLAGSGKLPTLWRDYQAGKTTTAQLRELAQDPDEHVRVWAIRLLTDFWPLDWVTGPNLQAEYPTDSTTTELLVRMAQKDSSGLVVRQLVSTLQRLAFADRYRLGKALLDRQEFGDVHDLSLLAWYGLSPASRTEPEKLVELAAASRWPEVNRWIARSLASDHLRSITTLDQLLELATKMEPTAQVETLAGMAEAFRGLRKVERPDHWPSFAALPSLKNESELIRDLNILFGDGRALDEVRTVVLNEKAEMKSRQSALETLISARPDDLRDFCEGLLEKRTLNATALQGLALYDDPEIFQSLIKQYKRFHSDDRGKVIEMLVSRASSAKVLLTAMAKNQSQIPVADISASHARQIQNLGNSDLSALLTKVWGELRESNAERREAIDSWKKQLTSHEIEQANKPEGRLIFNKICSGCHMLYGQGQKVGPDLTGAQRSSLEYLLENILDPSAVVGKDYRMTTVLLADGRVLNGLVVRKDDSIMVLRTATEQVSIEVDEIEQTKESNLSAMPDGLLQTLNQEQVRDLIGYLMSPVQIPLP
jgi:putative membrane-bound dehydrogenase-like protein